MQRIKKIFLALTRNERVAFFVFAPLALTSFIVVAIIAIGAATVVVPAAGGSYAEGMVGQPEYVNPVTGASETDLSLVKMVYSNIYDLADSVQGSADGRTWTIRLKEKLLWHDGEKLTSDDVIFTVTSIQNPDANSPLAASWQGVTVSRTSELEFQFKLANPYAFFGDNLKNLYILPKHLFADAPPGNWHLSDYNLKPIGSGPYEFSSYDKQSDGTIAAYHLQAWNNYAGTKPLISRFTFRYFGNVSDMVKSFNVGQVDAVGNLQAADLSSIDRPYGLLAWQTPSYYAIFFNQSKNLALQDIAVREALSVATDRMSLVSNVLAGHGAPENGPIPQGAPYYIDTPTLPGVPGVPTMTASGTPISPSTIAANLLDAAGWKTDASGKRSKMIQKSSIPLTINLTVPQVGFLEQAAKALADAWSPIGMTVNVTLVDPQTLLGGTIKNRDYEALLFGNILGPSSDLYAFWDSSQRFSPGLNLAIYSNRRVDALVEAARMDLNTASRTQQFASAEMTIAGDLPAIFLFSPQYLYAANNNLQGIATGFLPAPSDRFRAAGSWYLNTARVLK